VTSRIPGISAYDAAALGLDASLFPQLTVVASDMSIIIIDMMFFFITIVSSRLKNKKTSQVVGLTRTTCLFPGNAHFKYERNSSDHVI